MSFDDNTDLKSQGIYAGPVILNNIKSEKKVDCMLGSIFSSIEGVSNNLEKYTMILRLILFYNHQHLKEELLYKLEHIKQ